MPDKELEELMRETQRRKRLKTDLSEFEPSLKEMMDLNISLPVMLDWLERKGVTTTLPALRRYVKRVFGEDFYNDFAKRNGWLKTPKKGETEAVKKSVGPMEESAGALSLVVAETGFHKALKEIQQQNDSEDPRRND